MDKKCIAELVSSGYNMKHVPRPGSRKGGWCGFTIQVYYIIPPSRLQHYWQLHKLSTHGLCLSTHIDLHRQEIIARPFLTSWTSSLHFCRLHMLKSCGIQEYVHEPIHVLGHTLDVVISRDIRKIVSDATITDQGLWDHTNLHVTTSL